jgi:hypothetical protein
MTKKTKTKNKQKTKTKKNQPNKHGNTKNKEGKRHAKTEGTVKITVYLKDEQHRYHQNMEDDPRSSRRVSSSCFLRDNVKNINLLRSTESYEQLFKNVVIVFFTFTIDAI